MIEHSITAAETSASKVNSREQVLAALGLTPGQLAQHPNQITPDTKAYVGDLVNRDSQGKIIPIFRKLATVENIYTSYPEGQIPSWDLEIGGKSPAELERDLDSAKIEVSQAARSMVRSSQFTTLDESKTRRLVMPSVSDMGFQTAAITSQIFERAAELGLDECDPEVAVYQRLADRDQKKNTVYYIGMNRIDDSGAYHPGVFRLERDFAGLWLSDRWARSDRSWSSEVRMAFSLGSMV